MSVRGERWISEGGLDLGGAKLLNCQLLLRTHQLATVYIYLQADQKQSTKKTYVWRTVVAQVTKTINLGGYRHH